MVLFDVEDADLCTEGGDDIEQGGARGIHAERVEDELRVGKEEGGGEEEGGGGEVAGDGGVDGVEFLAALDAEFSGGVAVEAGAGEGCAEGSEGVLGVVAGTDRFGEGGDALGLEAGEEDGGLDLGGGDGGGEVDGVEGAADDGHGGVSADGAVTAGEVDLGTHFCQGRTYALHGARREGGVAGEDEGVRVGGDEAGEHAHGGAGVAAVEVVLGLAEVAACAGDVDAAIGLLVYDCAELGDAGEGGVRVGSGGEVDEVGCAFGEAGEHGVAVGDGFVAG